MACCACHIPPCDELELNTLWQAHLNLINFTAVPLSHCKTWLAPCCAAERNLYVRERNDGLYRVFTYLAAKMVDELAINAVVRTACQPQSLQVYTAASVLAQTVA